MARTNITTIRLNDLEQLRVDFAAYKAGISRSEQFRVMVNRLPLPKAGEYPLSQDPPHTPGR
jgi:hypothetical protein